jgi:hypothetical protein
MNKAKEKLQLCVDGLMELYSQNTDPLIVTPELVGTILGLHQLVAEALAALDVCQTCGGSKKKFLPPNEERKLGKYTPCPDCPPKPEQSYPPNRPIECSKCEGWGWLPLDPGREYQEACPECNKTRWNVIYVKNNLRSCTSLEGGRFVGIVIGKKQIKSKP